MVVTVEKQVELQAEITATVSDSENAHDIRVTIRVQINGKWTDLDVTNAFTPAEIQKFGTDVEDKYRDGKEAERDFGRGA